MGHPSGQCIAPADCGAHIASEANGSNTKIARTPAETNLCQDRISSVYANYRHVGGDVGHNKFECDQSRAGSPAVRPRRRQAGDVRLSRLYAHQRPVPIMLRERRSLGRRPRGKEVRAPNRIPAVGAALSRICRHGAREPMRSVGTDAAYQLAATFGMLGET